MKKVLIIAYYFPPSGGAGVQRWLKLSKYLAMNGVQVHVVTVDENYASYTQLDDSLVDDIHPAIKVYKTKSFEPINYYAKLVGKENIPTAGFSNVDNKSIKQKLVTAARSNLFIPDPRKGWKKYAVKKASEVIQKEKIKTIITTSPPHSVQLIGLALKKKFDLKWIVDFRDPWTDIYYYELLGHTRLSRYLDARLEKKIIDKADKIITVSQGCKDSFLSKTKNISPNKIQIIHNGFDPEDFEHLSKEKNNNIFTITYTGTISDQYEPQVFFKALEKLVQQNPNVPIKFQMIGSLSSSIQAFIESLSFDFEFIPTVPHSEINQYQKQADLLFLAIPNVSFAKGILTGKLFEYLGAHHKILAIGPEDGDVADVLQTCNAGKVFSRKNSKGVFDFLQTELNRFQNNLPSDVNENAIQTFSRKYQAGQVKELIE